MKNEKLTVFRFPFFMKMKNEWTVLKIQIKNLLNMKIVVNYLNFVFQFIKNTKWHFGYTDSPSLKKLNFPKFAFNFPCDKVNFRLTHRTHITIHSF